MSAQVVQIGVWVYKMYSDSLYLPRKTPYHISKSRDGTKFFWRAI